MPKVVHCKKELKTENTVYIGRPSKWGNPFTHKDLHPNDKVPTTRVGSREESIARFKNYLLNNPTLMASLHELKGKDLACWCAPYACHGDVLMELANK